MAPSYLDSIAYFTHFLTAYTHTLLSLRNLYPRATFLTSRFHNTSVYQSRHPAVCEWITDAIAAVRTELLAGSVAKIAIVIYWYGGAEAQGSPKVLERFLLDVSRFPVVEKAERNVEMEWEGADDQDEDDDDDDDDEVDRDQGHDEEGADRRQKHMTQPTDADVPVDMSEQFRAALVTLTTRCSQLKPLPKNCSFNISMELKDESDIDPPVGHPQPWIPVQPNLQKAGRKGADGTKEQSRKEGQDLGGVRTTPIRTVEAGVFRFESWIEEAKAKFDLDHTPKSSFASSGYQKA
ncbi:DNA-binding protein [Clohesyomyces aquaticus]|uniref:DNA-binding protein n=1 Tax=Clohesyomyces aquaticus TaxID=1231657 RepID=A0A1Y1ZZZ2_9PLEO|nr:DNA-binding protein [Clohesyomyces aquaticus]